MKTIRRSGRALILAFALLAAGGCDYLLRDLLPKDPAGMERRIFDLINAERTQAGLGPLIWNDDIAAEARGHSQNMADGTVPFGHDGFSERYARITQIIPAWAGGENVTYASDAELAVKLWMDSAGHRNNILGNYDYTGVGAAWSESLSVYYFTQDFILSR